MVKKSWIDIKHFDRNYATEKDHKLLLRDLGKALLAMGKKRQYQLLPVRL